MLKLNRPVALLLSAAAVLPLAGCAHGGKKADTAYVARDVSSLYTAAKRTMDNGDYEQAAKLFDEVERQHPYSVWARRAQLMSAFSYYLGHKYTDAINSAQRFVTIHPGNDEAPYAQYLIGMSYYPQIDSVTRDQTTTTQASDAFGELIRRYPESLCGRRAHQARPDQGPSRRQGDGDRPLLPAFRPMARRDLPLPHRRRYVPDHDPRARGAGTASRMLSRPRHSRGSAKSRCRARPQLS